MKTIKLYIEIPKDWARIDEHTASDISAMLMDTRMLIESKLEDKLLEKAVAQMKVPKIEITEQEIKDRMLDILAKKALKK